MLQGLQSIMAEEGTNQLFRDVVANNICLVYINLLALGWTARKAPKDDHLSAFCNGTVYLTLYTSSASRTHVS